MTDLFGFESRMRTNSEIPRALSLFIFPVRTGILRYEGVEEIW